jgi:toxin ParE1/3/4
VGSFRFTESAERDIDTILAYTMTRWGDAQTDLYISGLFDTLDLLSENASLGRRRPELASGLRSFPYGEHLIFYLLHEDAVLVVRVLGAKQAIKAGFFER